MKFFIISNKDGSVKTHQLEAPIIQKTNDTMNHKIQIQTKDNQKIRHNTLCFF